MPADLVSLIMEAVIIAFCVGGITGFAIGRHGRRKEWTR